MKQKIKNLEETILLAGKHDLAIPEPNACWQVDLMRAIQLAQPRIEPVAGMGPVAWKCAGAALAAAMMLAIISSHYGNAEEFIMLQSEISQTADYLLAQSL